MDKKTDTITVNGTIASFKLETRPPYNPYKYCGGETEEIFADMQIIDSDGIRYYCSKILGRHSARCAGPCAIVLNMLSEEGKKFAKEIGENKVAMAGKPNDNILVPLFKEGDTISIRARVKARKISKLGKPYVSLTHVKLIP